MIPKLNEAREIVYQLDEPAFEGRDISDVVRVFKSVIRHMKRRNVKDAVALVMVLNNTYIETTTWPDTGKTTIPFRDVDDKLLFVGIGVNRDINTLENYALAKRIVNGKDRLVINFY